jgi:putative MFS transporter
MTSSAGYSRISYEEAPLSAVHKKLAVGVFLGQITDGYTLSIVGAALSLAAVPLGLNSYWIGLIGAGALLGILFGSLSIGTLADKIGRKFLFTFVMFIFCSLSVVQFFISDPLLLTVVRFAMGFTIGSDYAVCPSLLTEWFPARSRARTISSFLMFWIIGFVSAPFLGILVGDLGENTWRWILASSAVPSGLAFLWRFATRIPESPSWLAKKGRIREAEALIHEHLGPNYGLPAVDLEKEVASGSWFGLFGPKLWRHSVVGGVFYATQVFPFFGFGIFLPLVLASLKIENPNAPDIMYNVCMVLGVLFGIWWTSKVTRVFHLLSTYIVCIGLLVTMIVWQDMPAQLSVTLLAAFALTLAAAAVLENTYPPELFPTELRASGIGFCTAVSRCGAAAGTFLLPVINEHYGIYASLTSSVVSLMIGALVVYLWAPETSNLVTAKVKGREALAP